MSLERHINNTLDLVITRINSLLTRLISDLNSDLNCILFQVSAMSNKNQTKKKFERHMVSNLMSTNKIQENKTIEYLNDLVHKYDSLGDVLDFHAPKVERTIHSRKPNP